MKHFPCRKRPEEAAAAGGEADGRETYYIVTDRWQVFTEEALTPELLEELQDSCDEFLVHAADVEGKKAGIEEAVPGPVVEKGRVRTVVPDYRVAVGEAGTAAAGHDRGCDERNGKECPDDS